LGTVYLGTVPRYTRHNSIPNKAYLVIRNVREERLKSFVINRYLPPFIASALLTCHARTLVTAFRPRVLRCAHRNAKMAGNDSRSTLPHGLEWFDKTTDMKLLRTSILVPVGGTDEERIAGMSICLSFGDAEGENAPSRPDDFPLLKLNAHQLKKVAWKLGYRNGTKIKREHCLYAIFCAATSKEGLNALASEGAASKQRSLKEKAIVVNRLVTILFHPTYRPSFEKMNGNKGHVEFDVTMGPNNKFFWQDVLDCLNDNNNPDKVLEKFIPMEESCVDLDRYIKYAFEAGDKSPSLPLPEPTTVANLQDVLKQLLDVRLRMETNMGNTGTNENDAMKYTAAALSKVGVARKISPFSAYYFFMLCDCNKSVLKTLTKSLPQNLMGSKPAKKSGDADADAKTPRSSRKEELKCLTDSMAENAEKLATVAREQSSAIMLQSQDKMVLCLEKSIRDARKLELKYTMDLSKLRRKGGDASTEEKLERTLKEVEMDISGYKRKIATLACTTPVSKRTAPRSAATGSTASDSDIDSDIESDTD
jgi:hypothetical protein